ncbi:hypothetical protein [Pigmentiphaga litoralis]|uniref:AraC family transcriptional regulator n=1 Tax=Pigmentiphaga litoralis TaxID=516702 RepID=A0A7Y9IRP6_9BURK|nr:hypothetical protein [Pigmentiphaga litoralis]NYE25063.1 hypothetical protein [Pigmentiphaga litoralis]NYE81323.1 hypothetical protein [Pigmentiphaga litoralis]
MTRLAAATVKARCSWPICARAALAHNAPIAALPGGEDGGTLGVASAGAAAVAATAGGVSRFRNRAPDSRIAFKRTIHASPQSTFCHSAGERRYRSGTSVTQLRLRIDQTAMTRYFGPDAWHTWAPDSSVRLCASQKTSEAVSAHVAAMLHQVTQESAASIDLYIPALSLLAKVMRGMQKAPSRSAGLSHRDLEKIEHVHEIMQTQLHRPLTLDYLCLTAGLSVFKLKDGIRRRYGTTPHRLLHDPADAACLDAAGSGVPGRAGGLAGGLCAPRQFRCGVRRVFRQVAQDRVRQTALSHAAHPRQ